MFKYIDNIPTITVLPPDNLMEGNSNDGSKFNRLMISDNTTEIIQSPIEIITVPSSEDDREDPGEDIPALSAVEVSESSGDEGGNDLEKGEPEKGARKGDSRVDPEDVPDLEDEEEFTQIWGKLGLQPARGQINIVKENWRKLKGQTEVIWQDLCQVIIDAFKEQGRMTCTEELHQLKEGLALVTRVVNHF